MVLLIGYAVLLGVIYLLVISKFELFNKTEEAPYSGGAERHRISQLSPAELDKLNDRAYVDAKQATELNMYYSFQSRDTALANLLAFAAGSPPVIRMESPMSVLQSYLECTTPKLTQYREAERIRNSLQEPATVNDDEKRPCTIHKARKAEGWLAYYEAGLKSAGPR